jgi:chromosome segregation protein
MKLSKLIVSGFKSFADRTEFEFDDGVSCIVGPNGCGKSNVVDAIKWVLGEQSAKSLRGSEMMDVVFNGSSSRKAAGFAEVTLVFDNPEGRLQPPISKGSDGEQVPVVSVTRKLYRDGQSEYRINKASCRLKDIREMFLDTGIGTNAYSVIEQGQVEGFLQASQAERRTIFDEAAGISKYKARKTEALRKLDRVEQNLLRLQDIVAEVEKRLRSIKLQAGKARNYQAYAQRLQELRSLFFLARYHQLTGQRTDLEQRVDRQTDRLASVNARIHQLESTRSSTEVEALDLERSARDLQQRVASLGGQITSAEQRRDMLNQRSDELGQQVVQLARRAEELEAKIEQGQAALQRRREELQGLDDAAEQHAQRYEELLEQFGQAEMGLTRTQSELDRRKSGIIDVMRQVSQLHNEAKACEVRQENLQAQEARLAQRTEEIDAELADLEERNGLADGELAETREGLDAARGELADLRQADERLSADQQQLQGELGALREQRSGVVSRIRALDEMQKRREGVAKGVRRLLDAGERGELSMLRGMLGSMLHADVDRAEIVEAALAGADQALLADRLADLAGASEQIEAALGEGGAAEMYALDVVAGRPAPEAIAHHALDGPVSRWVRCEEGLRGLLDALLGRTYLVDTLGRAVELRAELPQGVRLVTRSGEVLEADGRIRAGSASRGSGVIARGSELARLREESDALGERIDEVTSRFETAKDERKRLSEQRDSLQERLDGLNSRRVEIETNLAQLSQRRDRLAKEKPLLAGDMRSIAEQRAQARRRAEEHDARAAELEATNAESQVEIDRLAERIEAARKAQEALSERMTEAKVALAQAQEKKVSLRDAVEAATRQQQQWGDDLASARSEIELNRQRSEEAREASKECDGQIEGLYAEQSRLSEDLEEVTESRRGLSEKLEEIRKALGEERKTQESASESLGSLKVELGEADVRVENLISRASDEMDMDLGELYESYEHDEQRDWQAVEGEIKDLRGKIDRLGNVNLDAIAEQEQLEQRREFLAGQLDDVTGSRDQLNALIARINTESRELFLQTFQAVRESFQSLFRKLFGGGKADIRLADPEDVLESGIDIVARPPGKDLRNLSLLSGGEKTMTALALLFSIFRSRPSPFCLLDEVDAALDEANTERFSTLVQEFVSTSQFIIITHAKRTMSMADVLYGVTMEDPGVSKRVSVRFQDSGEPVEALEPAGV